MKYVIYTHSQLPQSIEKTWIRPYDNVVNHVVLLDIEFS
jgi:hypothetical protein